MFQLPSVNICIILIIIGSLAFGDEYSSSKFTAAEKIAIKQLREAAADILYLDYHKYDLFLIHWLRKAKLDVNLARELLANAFKWRKSNGIDSILEDENMIKLEKAFPHSLDGVDKEGRPILTLHFQFWNIRRVMLAGKGKDLTRYLDYIYEKGSKKVRDIHASTQSEVNEAILIVDLNGFSSRQHACLPCFSFYIDLVQHDELYYPNAIQITIFINSNRAVENLFRALRPFLSEYVLQTLFIFGLNKAEWSPFLLERIEPDQLPVSFGGTRNQTMT